MKKIEKKAYSKNRAGSKDISSTGVSLKSLNIGIKKQYLKSGNMCRVTFRLPKEAAPDARVVTLAGDFITWNTAEAQMKKLRNGDFTLTLELPCNKEYHYRYLIDESRWENDWYADRYAPNPYGCDDSVVVV